VGARAGRTRRSGPRLCDPYRRRGSGRTVGSPVQKSQDQSEARPKAHAALADVLAGRGEQVLASWVTRGEKLAGRRGADDLGRDGAAVLQALAAALTGADGLPDLAPVTRLLSDFSVRRARSGGRPAETAGMVLGLREALLAEFDGTEFDGTEFDAAGKVDWFAVAREAGRLVDELALGSFDSFLAGREEVISQQGEQLLELSTPVVRVWDRVVAAPLVGTLDSARAQVVMESLLQAISDDGALVAILDITGVPTVDTLVAQHLLKTVAATRLMGADCIVSGIAPQTAQTMVQLGIDLSEVTTRASLADALAMAITRVQAHADRAARR
jgi:rsbT co-antagonist protein RsbR